jgi:hypothetical protein
MRQTKSVTFVGDLRSKDMELNASLALHLPPYLAGIILAAVVAVALAFRRRGVNAQPKSPEAERLEKKKSTESAPQVQEISPMKLTRSSWQQTDRSLN